MTETKEIVGGDALRIKQMAYEFNSSFSDCFKDTVMRLAIWTEPNDDDLILIKVMACDIDGRFVKYLGQYMVEDGEFFCDKKMSKAFVNSRCRDKAVRSLEKFILDIITIKYTINRVMLDLGVSRYESVKIGKSKCEKGSIDVFICAYSDRAKDDYNFIDAKKIVGTDLATF